MKKLGMIILSLAAFTASAAENLELDLNLYLNNELVKSQVIQAETGKMHSVTADKVIKLDITPTLKDNIVTLTSVMHKFENGIFSKFQEPMLMVKLNEPASIEMGTENVQIYKIEVTAKKYNKPIK
ncbi:hypothetical protein [Thalassotalea sp. PLHSN55]|uniref:hypothetical protein n=1 Tax=Thalassotalea sp. PLHSN55 TaxID=3435888 RepID=UPI003F845554